MIGSYRKRFRLSDTKRCDCGARKQDVTHLILMCKHWKHQRKKLLKVVREKGVIILPRLDKRDGQSILYNEMLIDQLFVFLKGIRIGLLKKREEEEWLDKWDIELLDLG